MRILFALLLVTNNFIYAQEKSEKSGGASLVLGESRDPKENEKIALRVALTEVVAACDNQKATPPGPPPDFTDANAMSMKVFTNLKVDNCDRARSVQSELLNSAQNSSLNGSSKPTCSDATTDYITHQSEALKLCKQFKGEEEKPKYPSSKPSTAPETYTCDLVSDMDNYEKSCVDQWATSMEAEIEDKDDHESAKALLHRCEFLAADLTARSDISDAKRALSERKSDCQKEISELQRDLKKQEGELKSAQNALQNVMSKSANENAKQSVEQMGQLRQLQSQIKTMTTTGYSSLLGSFRSAELDADSACQKEIIEQVGLIQTRAKRTRSMTSRNERTEIINKAKAAFESCKQRKSNEILKAQMAAGIQIQDLQNKLNEASAMQQQMQMSVSLASQQQSQEMQQKMMELANAQQQMHQQYQLNQASLQQRQQMCSEDIADLTADLNELSGAGDREEQTMQAMLMRQMGISGTGPNAARKLGQFAGVSESDAKRAEAKRDKINEKIAEIEKSAAEAYGACCAGGKSGQICESFKSQFKGDPLIRRHTGTR